MEDPKVVKWMEKLSKGLGREVEARATEGIQIQHVEKGFVRCTFVVPKHLSDKDGNWHVGAMAILIDIIGAGAIFSTALHDKVSVVLDISYYSTAKIQEEVEIEAKVVVGHKERLSAVVVVLKKKGSGHMIALSKQWMTSRYLDQKQPSKL